MGEVWLALDEELDERPVAIKVMHAQRLADAEDIARFQREMRLAARMRHQNIVSVYTTGTDNGVPFMVMEYLEGRDLGKMPRGLDAGEVARIGRETCDALSYAHGLNPAVVHRDIKPGNLFVCENGQVKVTDFGIAKAISGTSLTAAGTVMGTMPYMAPEQWLGGEASFGNDIWAVGCVLYEMLSGKVPRSYATPAEYLAAAARREPVPVLPQSAPAPAWLRGAVMAMLEPDPRNRPAARECLQLLTAPQAHVPPPVTAPSPGAAVHPPTQPALPPQAAAPLPSPKRVRRPVLGAAALAGVVAAGTAIALSLSHGPPGGTGKSLTGATGHAASVGSAVGSPSTAVSEATSTAQTLPAQAATPTAAVTQSPAAGMWIAQLASVPQSAGLPELQRELGQVRTAVPGAQYLDSSNYASLNPGYWVIYYQGTFTNGTQAVDYCAAHGLTTRNQCVGRFLSNDISDKQYICLPPGGPRETGCSRPA